MLQDLERMADEVAARAERVERLQRRLEAADLPGVVLGFMRQVVRGQVLKDATHDGAIRAYVAEHATAEVRATCDSLHSGFTHPRFDTVMDWLNEMDRAQGNLTEAEQNTPVMGRGTVTLGTLVDKLANLLLEWDQQRTAAAA
jgi:hypothetical protein